jgi:hypothetical protein
MKRSLVVLVLTMAAACDAGPKVLVRAEIDGQPVADLPVRLLPYDRQAILDSLASAREEPEPRIPQELLQRLSAVQAEEARLRQSGDTALRRVSAERQSLLMRIDTVRKARAAWLEEIREPYEEAARERADGSGEPSDTTDAAGRAEIAADAGRWWLVARYVLPETVLEWEVPVTVRGDSAVVTLSRKNATAEPLLP